MASHDQRSEAWPACAGKPPSRTRTFCCPRPVKTVRSYLWNRRIGSRTQLSSMPMKNEWKSLLRDESGTATLKESFEMGELVHDEKTVAVPQGTTPRSIAQDNEGDPLRRRIRDSRVQQSTLSTRTNFESCAPSETAQPVMQVTTTRRPPASNFGIHYPRVQRSTLSTNRLGITR